MYLKGFWLQKFSFKYKRNFGKFDSKVFEGIFVAYSSTSKAYRIFNRYTLTIEESMHVKFKESNKFVKNIVDVQINSLCKDMDKATLKDAPIQEKSKDEEPSKNDQEECLEEVQPSQPLPRDWEYTSSHPKDLIR